MSSFVLDPVPLDRLPPPADPARAWVWQGVLARGDVALLTSAWKTGKTTLLAGLLHALGGAGTFLGRSCAAGRAVVVSEEATDVWAERVACIPVGPHARLVSRPFAARPTAAEWDDFVTRLAELRADGGLDLVVVDPLAEFLPGRAEAAAVTMHDFVRPLRRLADRGTAVLVLHHPRRNRAEEGSAARGSGALLATVDVILELHRVGVARAGPRRRLTARGRRPGTAGELVYEWVPGTPEFRAVPDDPDARFRENWEAVRALLANRTAAATHKELLADWPVDADPPCPSVLYDWLRRAAAAGLAERTGSGTRLRPFRFALPRPKLRPGELPDLPPLEPLWG